MGYKQYGLPKNSLSLQDIVHIGLDLPHLQNDQQHKVDMLLHLGKKIDQEDKADRHFDQKYL